MGYAELHCHSYYSFHDGASSLEELMLRSKGLGYNALALTDHDNLCGAMRFSLLARSMGVKAIIGAEVTLRGGYHITFLAENKEGYRNLSQLITSAHNSGKRSKPELPPGIIPARTAGLIALSGCCRGELSSLVDNSQLADAVDLIRQYLGWFGVSNFYIELQNNLVYGDTGRNRILVELARQTGSSLVFTGNVHYHIRERHPLQDCLVAIKHNKCLEESHRERRTNSEFYMRSIKDIEYISKNYPDAMANTVKIAERCNFDLARDQSYTFPVYNVPEGYTPETHLEKLCHEAAVRRYGAVTPQVKHRLDEEFKLVRKFNLAGFLLLYNDVINLGREAMIDLDLSDPSLAIEENPPGRGRGSSVSLLIGYLIGLSHIDPLKYDLSLERFLPDDAMGNVPDIDLDFPRSIREELILRTHVKWGWDHAALAGTICTYLIKGAVRDLGKALSLPLEEVDQLSKHVSWGSAKELEYEMQKSPKFQEKIGLPVWQDLIRLAFELDGFPKYLGQHPGGMIISSTPLTDIVPVQRGAIEGRYVCQWDKDSIDDAGFVKIDFLALGALSQMQQAVELIKQRTGQRIDMSRIDFEDKNVYDMLAKGDTIGIFQVESAAQIQTITRLQPRNLTDMAHEVGAVRPGVGVNGGVQDYLARRLKQKPVTYDHPLEERALGRTLGVVLFQDQVNQLAIDVAGFNPSKADQMRRAFGRRHNTELIKALREEFFDGAKARRVDEPATERIFKKFNGQYMFPESHAFAFGITAYQASWLKLYYPLEFFVAIFNEQPMGFYNLETLKEDAKRHAVTVLNPDINKSSAVCVIEDGKLRLGFLNVSSLGSVSAKGIEDGRTREGSFREIGDFLERSGILEAVAFNLADAGAFDSIQPNRREAKWEIGLRYRPVNTQMTLQLPVEQDMTALDAPDKWERMKEEYNVLSLYPTGHIMEHMRPHFRDGFCTSAEIEHMHDGAEVLTAGLVIRRQRPRGKVVFITLEDEFGHVPVMVFPGIYEKDELKFRSSFLVIHGRLARRDGTHNVIVDKVQPFNALDKVPSSKDWR